MSDALTRLDEARREIADAAQRVATLAAAIPDSLPPDSGVIATFPAEVRDRLWASRTEATGLVIEALSTLRSDRDRLDEQRRRRYIEFFDAMSPPDFERLEALHRSIRESERAMTELEDEIESLESLYHELDRGPADATNA